MTQQYNGARHELAPAPDCGVAVIRTRGKDDSPTAQPVQPEAEQRFQWTCDNGCGVCDVKRIEFEYWRSEDIETGALIESKTKPLLVSACCGNGLAMWDNLKDEQIEVATVAVEMPVAKTAPAAASPARPSPEWYQDKIKQTLDDDFTIGAASPEQSAEAARPALSDEQIRVSFLETVRDMSKPGYGADDVETDLRKHPTLMLKFARAIEQAVRGGVK